MEIINSNIFQYLTKIFSEDFAKKYIDFIIQEPALYLRINRLKTDKETLKQLLLDDYSIETSDVKDIPFALKVETNKSVTGRTIHHINGLFYMQGLSSMIPPIVLDPKPDDNILDLCSAPGSKTTEIAEMMENKGSLTANEIAVDRVKMLAFNVDRMNIVNTGVVHYRGEWLSKIFDNYFDKVLVDAPCSGLGIIQKKEEVNNWWSLDSSKNLADTQLRLLTTAIKMLRPGGELIYSTCTLAIEENEAIINKVLNKYPVEIADITLPVPSIQGFTSYEDENFNPDLAKARRIIPWEADSDGFFICKLIKTDSTNTLEPVELRGENVHFYSAASKEMKKYVTELSHVFGIDEKVFDQYKYIFKKGEIFFVNKDWFTPESRIFNRIGTKFGVQDKTGYVTLYTNAAQVLEKHIVKNIYDIQNKDELKKYFEGATLKTSIPYGQYVVKYKNNIMGTAISTSAGLKSRFPRVKRTQGIDIPQ